MSLNLIIMLVIGLTVLGLIIAFVTGFLGDATEGIGQTLPGDEELLRDVSSRSGNFEFLRRDVSVRRGSSTRLYVKFENPLSSDVSIFNGGTFNHETDGNLQLEISGSTGVEQAQEGISIVAPPISLGASQSDAYPFELRVSSGVPTGNYFLSFSVVYGEGDEARSYSRVVTVTVE